MTDINIFILRILALGICAVHFKDTSSANAITVSTENKVSTHISVSKLPKEIAYRDRININDIYFTDGENTSTKHINHTLSRFQTTNNNKDAFVASLKNGESLSSYFNNKWTLVYHKDNRCDGATDGEYKNLSTSKIDESIEIEVTNDGDGWACEKKQASTYSFNFNLKEQIKNWDRFEMANYENEENHIAYVLGAGASDYLKLHYNEDHLIIKLEYRSEDPG
ncbi:hypothetical protein HNV08_08300 [Winogradskyella eckloniae]|uniref:hypothetical protein n=1 Tax=Winogradskyella eckloniae TaxID=1089306 RepID=UPI0015659CFB|nr:hypothetical protein [Winogradskyella eckloniae]NRD20047.1 hypothetical protein [Winogradskyella eckloniae]